MPVLAPVEEARNVQGGDYEKGVEIPLSEEQKRQIVLTHHIINGTTMAAFRPEGFWFEQVTTDVARDPTRSRIQVEDLNGEPRGVQVDDGIVIDLMGTMDRLVGILPGRAPMSEDEVDSHIDVTGDNVPMFQQWNFRVTKMLLTSGPAARENLTRSEDQKRAQSQADMYTAFKDMYAEGTAQQAQMFQMFMGMMKEGKELLNAEGELNPSVDAVAKAGKLLADAEAAKTKE